MQHPQLALQADYLRPLASEAGNEGWISSSSSGCKFWGSCIRFAGSGPGSVHSHDWAGGCDTQPARAIGKATAIILSIVFRTLLLLDVRGFNSVLVGCQLTLQTQGSAKRADAGLGLVGSVLGSVTLTCHGANS